MNVPKELRYTASHEWTRREPDGTVSVGITDHAQEQLGDIVFVEAPQTGRKVAKGESVGVVESVKAASDIYSPISGTVVEVNAALADHPEQVNTDPYAGGWMVAIRPAEGFDPATLLDWGAYEALITGV